MSTTGAILEDRKRIHAILTSKEALANPELAVELAVVSGMGVAPALGILTKAPAPKSPYAAEFEQAMAATGTVGINGPSNSGGPVDPKVARLEELRRNGEEYNRSRGYRA